MDNYIKSLDPYQFMAVIGKKVIHPGGKKSTDELFEFLEGSGFNNVLDIGCGVGTTALRLASEFQCKVTGIDIDSSMVAKAKFNHSCTSLNGSVRFEIGDITNLQFKANEFDLVIVEAVTMFVKREKAVSEIYRVCKPGGIFLDQEFIWKETPNEEERKIFTKDLCPGINFESTGEWKKLFENHGFNNFQVKEGPFRLMSPGGFIYDEGLFNTLKIMLKVCFRSGYREKMLWMMSKMLKINNKLGYSLIFCKKQLTN